MKKDTTKDIHSPKPRLRVASINYTRLDKDSEKDENSTRGSKRSRSDNDTESDLPQFYHHPRRPRNFDPL